MEYAKPDINWGNVIQELGKLGPAARPAIPLLREAATNWNGWTRHEAQEALEKIEAASTNKDSRAQ